MMYSEINVGDRAYVEKTISESDVYLYAGITGDLNPAHVNEEIMKKSSFGGRIAHGMLSAGLISAVLGMQLPGPGTIYLSQNLRFRAPVRIGDTVKAEAEVTEKLEKGRIKLKTTCSVQDTRGRRRRSDGHRSPKEGMIGRIPGGGAGADFSLPIPFVQA